MPTTTRCPEIGLLERLLLGRISADDAQPLEDHVVACSHCTAELQQLHADDPLVESLRQTPPALEQADTPLVQALIPCLKRLLPNDPERTQAGEALPPAAPDADGYLDFLAPPQMADELGRLGGYRVLKVLGEGGMGVVFLAEDPRLKRHLALKAIRPELVQRGEIRERFLREAQAIARVEHDNIVAIFQVEEDHGVPFLAMPLLRGETLEQRLQRASGPLPLDETLRIGREIAAGLAAAHDHGLVHRDIKPANIFLSVVRWPSSVADSATLVLSQEDPFGQAIGAPVAGQVKVKILDFGLVRAVQADAAEGSQHGQILGTPMYMAPEQGRGLKVDRRADLFSLGCVLYRMATGRPAFSGPDFMSVMVSVATVTPTPPRQLNPDLPPALEGLIEQLLTKNPEERPQSAHAVLEAVRSIEQQQVESLGRKTSRRGLLIAAAAAVLVVSGLAAGLAWWAARPQAPRPPEPGEVTFDFDETAVPLALRRGDEEEQPLDPAYGRTHRLAPGWYQVRPTVEIDKRHLIPSSFEVREGAALKVTLRLVGELRKYSNFHDHPVMSVSTSPKVGELTVLSASMDGSVGVWKPFAQPPDPPVHYFREHTSEVHAVAFAPDGTLAASGGGGKNPRTADFTIRLWDVRSRQQIDQLRGHASCVEALAFSPNGRQLLSADSDGSIYLWDVSGRTRSSLRVADGHGVYSVAFASDGQHALTGGDRLAIVWDLANHKEIQRLDGHGGTVRAVLFGPAAGELTTTCDDGLIRVWSGKGEMLRELKGHKDAVNGLALSPDGKWLLTGGRDGTVRLWNAATGREAGALDTGNPVHSVAFTIDGRRALSGGSDRGIRVWGDLPP